MPAGFFLNYVELYGYNFYEVTIFANIFSFGVIYLTITISIIILIVKVNCIDKNVKQTPPISAMPLMYV